MNKISKTLVVILIAFLVAGCGKIPVLKNGEEAVATLDAGDISVDELYEQVKDKFARDTLIDMIDTTILNKVYKETDDEKDYIDDNVKDIKDYAEQYNYTLLSFIKYSYGLNSEEELRTYLSLSYKRTQAAEDYVSKKLTEKEINNYYDENIHGDINAKHILIAPEKLDGMTTEETEAAEAKALATAKSIIKKLNAGEKWDELAKEYSDDASNASKGGDLGWFNTGEMEAEFEDAAFALKKGKYTTTPVKTAYGYHVIYLVDSKAKPKLEEVKDEVIDALVSQKLTADSKLYYEALEDLRKEHNLEIVDSELKKQYNSYMKELKEAKNTNQ